MKIRYYVMKTDNGLYATMLSTTSNPMLSNNPHLAYTWESAARVIAALPYWERQLDVKLTAILQEREIN